MQLSIQTHKTIRGHTWHQCTWNDIGQKPELASKTASSEGIPIAVHIIVSTAVQGLLRYREVRSLSGQWESHPSTEIVCLTGA